MKDTQGLTRLVAALKGLDAKGASLADRLEAEAAGLAVEMETTTAIIDTVAKTRAALRQVNQAMNMGDNGGPAGPLPDLTLSAAPPSPEPAPDAPLPVAATPAADPAPDAPITTGSVITTPRT